MHLVAPCHLHKNSESEPAYSISEWHDTDAIYARLAALIKQPIRPIRRENMASVLAYFEQKCNKSKLLFSRAEKLIPGGIQHNLSFNYPFPLAMDEANGAYLTDIDGNRYIDFLKAGGPTLLGSNDINRPAKNSCAAGLLRPSHRPAA